MNIPRHGSEPRCRRVCSRMGGGSVNAPNPAKTLQLVSQKCLPAPTGVIVHCIRARGHAFCRHVHCVPATAPTVVRRRKIPAPERSPPTFSVLLMLCNIQKNSLTYFRASGSHHHIKENHPQTAAPQRLNIGLQHFDLSLLKLFDVRWIRFHYVKPGVREASSEQPSSGSASCSYIQYLLNREMPRKNFSIGMFSAVI